MINTLKTCCIEYVITHNINIKILDKSLQYLIKRYSKKYNKQLSENILDIFNKIQSIIKYDNFTQDLKIVTKSVFKLLDTQNVIYDDYIVINYINKQLFCNYIHHLVINIQIVITNDEDNITELVYDYIINHIRTLQIVYYNQYEFEILDIITNNLNVKIYNYINYIFSYLDLNLDKIKHFIKTKNILQITNFVIKSFQSYIICEYNLDDINNIVIQYLSKFKTASTLMNLCLSCVYNYKINNAILPKHIIKQLNHIEYTYMKLKNKISMFVIEFNSEYGRIVNFNDYLDLLNKFIINILNYYNYTFNNVIVTFFLTELALYTFISLIIHDMSYVDKYIPVVLTDQNNLQSAFFDAIYVKLEKQNIDIKKWSKFIDEYLTEQIKYCKVFNYYDYFKLKFDEDDTLIILNQLNKQHLIKIYIIQQLQSVITDFIDLQFIEQYIDNIIK